MKYLLMLPSLGQMTAMLIDEFYFHLKRKLPAFERWGHPVDTFFFLLCSAFLLVFEPTNETLIVYLALSLFSSFIITKDEWIHKKECVGGELWIHSVLFILHPVVLMVLGAIWYFRLEPFYWLVALQAASSALFLVYQIIFWNIIWKKK